MGRMILRSREASSSFSSSLTLGLQADQDKPAVRVVRAVPGQAALLQGFQHPGERSIGESGLGGPVSRLLVITLKLPAP
jgi:hypothetical protein